MPGLIITSQLYSKVTLLRPGYRFTKAFIVRGVRAIKGLFGSDSSKSTKFGTEVDDTIWFTFLPVAKTGAQRGRHIGKIQHDRHPVGCKSQVYTTVRDRLINDTLF